MARKVIQDSVIPARHGMAFEVKKGQVLRIYQTEERQVGDCVFFNAHDYKEWFHTGQTLSMNTQLKLGGSALSLKRFYSKAPRVNLMLTVLEDTTKNHSGHLASRCSRRSLDLTGRKSQERSCDLNLTEALRPYGLTGDDIMDVFNVFMSVKLHEDGTYELIRSTALKGDHVDLLAEMDILAAISACPAESVINDNKPHSLGVQIMA